MHGDCICTAEFSEFKNCKYENCTKRSETKMNIGDYKVGTVVMADRKELGYDKPKYGHVLGFSRNAFGELVIIIQWELNQNDLGFMEMPKFHENISAIHPTAIRIL